MSINDATSETAPTNAGVLYRTIWRWHFYAGLICLPFFVLLATTGAIYLFRDELTPVIEHHRLIVDPTVRPAMTPDALIARAAAVQDGTPVRFTPPPAADRSAEVGLRGPNREVVSVFLNPFTGEVLDRVADEHRPMQLISHIHSLEILGKTPNLVIEMVAGWAILLVASGVFLWWPRGRRQGVITIRATPSRRLWWRDLHAVTGAFACVILLFLAVTGMPWSGYWGENFRRIVNEAGLGMPAQSRAAAVASDAALAATKAGSWTMDPAAAPTTQPSGLTPLKVSEVVSIARARHVQPGYVVRLPTSAGGVYTIQSYPRKATGQRVIHIDQYSGRIIADIGFADYGPVSKAVEWGIAVHTGGQLGPINQWFMLAGCLAIITLSISAGVMWWKRRPVGKLAAPPAPPAPSVSAFALIAAAVGLILPLLGLSILAAFAVDLLVSRPFKLKYAL